MAPSQWASGAAYEGYIGRWSRPVATAFIRWLSLPAHQRWLDFGCGTGALSQAILAEAHPHLLIGYDRSPQYVAHATSTIRDPRCRFVVGELPALPQAPGEFDVVVSGLVLNFLPTPPLALHAFKDRLRPGGTVAAYVWDYAQGMQLLRAFWDAVIALDPSARAHDEGVLFPLCAPEPLRQLFTEAGLTAVAVTELTVTTAFESFDDYWTPFLGAQGPGGHYVSELAPRRRDQLADHLRRTLPFQADGTLHLTARAWAVRGIAG